MTREVAVELAFVGGGLATGLAVLALRAARPGARIAVLEQAAQFGGNHTWCFHDSDVPAAAAPWFDTLVEARWSDHEVAFPAHRRVLSGGYGCVTAPRLADALARALDAPGSFALTGHTATGLEPEQVLARDASGAEVRVRAQVVIDARGPRTEAGGRVAFQKFLGQELSFAAPHAVTRPMLMDATVEQIDGFRFVYVLPLSATRLLVEDTYYSSAPELDRAELRRRVAAYVADRALGGAYQVIREEEGVLPLPLAAEAPRLERPLALGYAGGWMHPVTGYSLPIALRVAQAVARTPVEELPGGGLAAVARQQAQQLPFSLRLNRMLFGWFAPAERFHVLERFYRLPEATIARFYAHELTRADRARILCGRPPRGMSWKAVFVGGAP